MKRHIGVKMINAIAMDRGAYNRIRGWEVPADEDPTDAGYLVEYLDGGQANHPNFEGYISWSPKAVFEKAYRPITGMTFGLAIEAAKLGHRIARLGWNAANQWVNFSPGHPALDKEDIWTDHVKEVAEMNGGAVAIRPYFNLKTITNDIQPGWVPSQSDMLADDWFIVTDEE